MTTGAPVRVGRLALAVLITAFSVGVSAEPQQGRTIVSLIAEFRQAGLNIAYSSNLLSEEFTVLEEPTASSPQEQLAQVLKPYGLTLLEQAGVLLVVRDKSRDLTRAGQRNTRQAPSDAGRIENIQVSASRYEIARDIAASKFQIDRRSIQTLPDVGEDPLRAVQRLPGTAASGASARTHFRGGEQSEVGIVLNGQRLFDPFHVRDYQSIFSAVDARAIEGVEVFTGGFSARYGDRIGGYVLMETLDGDDRRHNEIGLSVFNTSFLTTGAQQGKQWLFSARRGNLDLVIDKQFGEPSYYDVFGEVAVELGSATRLSMNVLHADDLVTVVLESDPTELEQVSSDTQNTQAWLQLETDWSDRLSTSTLVSYGSYVNRRAGSLGDAEKLIASVDDRRDVSRFSLRQDWRWQASDDRLLQWGVQFAAGDAAYRYAATAEYFSLSALYEGQPANASRFADIDTDGGNYAAYVEDRIKLTGLTTVEWGLRWDDQSYTGSGSDAQLSPRLSVLRSLGKTTDLRLSWGRYHQAQGLHELQVEDGISNFWPAQRADLWIAGLQHGFDSGLSLRLEAFYKDIARTRPRFENLFDPLGLIPELQPDRIRLDPSSAHSTGLELSVEQATRNWNWWAAYTLSRSQDRIEGRDVDRSWDQRHALQGGFGWRNQHWDLSAAISIHSGWPATALSLVESGEDADGEPLFTAIPGERNAERYPTFASLDLRVSRSFDLRRGKLTAFFELSNASNRKNQCCIDWDIESDGTDTMLESSPDFWLPRLPAIGVLWEF